MKIAFTVILLILGSMNTATSNDAGNQNNLDFLSKVSEDFSVEIEFVSASLYNDKEIIPKNNVYDIRTNDQLAMLTITAKFSGYTSWNLGNVTVPQVIPVMDFGNSTITIGQYFLLVDDRVQILSDLVISQGIPISLSPGDHIVTILYIGRDEKLGTVFDHKSVIVRVRSETAEFGNYNLIDIPAELQISDSYKEGIVRAEAIIELGNALYRNIAFNPTSSTESVFLDNKNIGNFDSVILPSKNVHNLTANFITNSTGFEGIQMKGEWESVQGVSFFVDAQGLHEGTPNIVSLHNGLNFIGVYTFAPYGLWHEDILYGVDNLFRENQTNGIMDWEGYAYAYEFYGLVPDSSFDFLGQSTGIFINVAVGEQETTTIDDASFLFGTLPVGVIVMLRKRKVIT